MKRRNVALEDNFHQLHKRRDDQNEDHRLHIGEVDLARQQHADGHREQVGEKYISVLQLFAFTCHEEGKVLSNSYLLILP